MPQEENAKRGSSEKSSKWANSDLQIGDSFSKYGDDAVREVNQRLDQPRDIRPADKEMWGLTVTFATKQANDAK